MAGTKKTSRRRAVKKEGATLLKRRIIATVALVLAAGFATLSAFVWTKPTKADTNFDPFFSLSTGSPKVRIFQPLQQSLDNPSDFVANGQATPGSTVILKVDGNQVGSAVANDKGLWSKNVTGVANGDHELTASATISGPLAVVASADFAPGFGLLNLPTNSLTSSYNTGISSLAFSFFGQYGGQDPIVSYVATPQNSQFVYLLRKRSLIVADVTTQKVIKTINFSARFMQDNNDNGQSIRAIADDPQNHRVYLLFSNSDASQVLSIDTSANTLVNIDQFNPAIQAGATGMVMAANKLYITKEGANTLQSVNVSNGNVNVIGLESGLTTAAALPDGSAIYVAEATNENNYVLSRLSTTDDTVQEQVVDLGSALPVNRMYASPSGQKLYALSNYSGDLRVINLNDNAIEGVVGLGSPPQIDATLMQPVFNNDGSRIYVPLQTGKVAIVNTTNNSFVGNVNAPNSSYTSLHALMYYNGKIYTGYTRQLSPTDITDFSQLFNTIGVSDANTSSDVTPQTITSPGTATAWISPPITISPQTYTGSTQFSVGTPLSITSPADGDTLDASNPVIKGKGPKGKTIQLIVNNGSSTNVTVGNDGNWQTQVTLPKGKSSKVSVAYENKRAQVIVPNITVMGANIAKSELSVIDGNSGLQQQPINLADIGLQNVKLNNSAAINPNGQRYYLVGNDATSMVNTVMNLVLGGGSESGDIAQQIINQLTTLQAGSITVYSAQTRQQVATISLPGGMFPLGMAVSPDGKKGMVTAIDIGQELALINGQQSINDQTTAPVALYTVNLENNTLDTNKISYTMNLKGFTDGATQDEAMKTYFSMASGIFLLSRPGSFNSDGSKFYTTALSPGKFSVINMSNKQVSTVSLPSQYNNAILMSSQFNKTTGTLYATYINISIPLDESGNLTGAPQFIPGILLLDPANNQVVGQSTLPNLPLFNFAVSSNGSKLYFLTANFSEIISALTSTEPNPNGLLADTLPEFSIGVYDLNLGAYNDYPLTNTEIPISLALSPDDSRVFVPTLAGNVVHVFDTASNQVDPGNAPVVLPGLIPMFGTGDYVANATIGAYSASGSYYVPPDAPVEPKCGDCTQTIIQNNPGVTQFRYLSAAQQAAVAPQSITLPQQTLKTVQQTVQKTIEQQKKTEVQKIQRTWLIYIFYTLLMLVLTTIGVTVWRTDMVLGRGVSQDLFA